MKICYTTLPLCSKMPTAHEITRCQFKRASQASSHRNLKFQAQHKTRFSILSRSKSTRSTTRIKSTTQSSKINNQLLTKSRYRNKTQFNFKIEEKTSASTIITAVARDKAHGRVPSNMIGIEACRCSRMRISSRILEEFICSSVHTVSRTSVNLKFQG